MEIVSLKCDYCFKEWFSNETVRKYFISDVLDIPVGERYSKLKRCVGISILDFNLTEDESYHRVYRLRDESGNFNRGS